MFQRIRNAILGPHHIPTPGALVVDGTTLVLSCDDTSATTKLRINGKREAYSSTMWTGEANCKLIDGKLDFLVLCDSPTPPESIVARVRGMVDYPNSMKRELNDAVFAYFNDLRTQHAVDFSAVLPVWSFDGVIDTLRLPSVLINEPLGGETPRVDYLISFSTELDEEHGVDVSICDWTVTGCGCLV